MSGNRNQIVIDSEYVWKINRKIGCGNFLGDENILELDLGVCKLSKFLNWKVKIYAFCCM